MRLAGHRLRPRGPEIRSRAQKKMPAQLLFLALDCFRACRAGSARCTRARLSAAFTHVGTHGRWWRRDRSTALSQKKKYHGEPCRPDLATNYSGANQTAPTRSSLPRLAVAGGYRVPSGHMPPYARGAARGPGERLRFTVHPPATTAPARTHARSSAPTNPDPLLEEQLAPTPIGLWKRSHAFGTSTLRKHGSLCRSCRA